MKNQKGLSLLEFMFILAIASTLLILNMQSEKKDAERGKAAMIGAEMVKYNNAVTSYVSYNVTKDRYHQDGTAYVEYSGADWLKDSNCTSGSNPEDIAFINCEFEDNLKGTSFNFNTFIADNGVGNYLKAISYIDLKYIDSSGETNTYFSEDILGLAAMSAIGNNYKDVINLDPDELESAVDIDGESLTTNIMLANTGISYYYCPLSLAVEFLNENCTKDGSTKEGGLLVMVSSTDAENDSWLRTDGSNPMKNDIGLSSVDAEEREIVGVDRLYNLTGEVIKLGNSDVFYEDGSWAHFIGDGVVLDTDVYMVSALKISQDAEFDSNLSIANDLFIYSNTYMDTNVVVDYDVEVSGNFAVAGDTRQGGNKMIAGDLYSQSLDVNSYITSEEVNVAGNLYAEAAISSAIIRSSDTLVSEGDLSVKGDMLTKNMFTEGDVIVSKNILTNGDLIAQEGGTYLNSLYANYIIDGEYMLNPDGSSRFNTIRSNKLMSNDGNLNLRGESILFAAESTDCNAAEAGCATNVEGYIDISKVNIKSPDGGSWVSLMGFLEGMEDYISDVDGKIGEIAEVITEGMPEYINGWSCNGSTKGVRLGETNALDGQSKYGWACNYQDNHIIDDVYDDEPLYICEINCAAPPAPSGAECVSPGILDELAISYDPAKSPSGWSCTVKETIGSENIYECTVPCRLPDPPCTNGNIVDQGWFSTCESYTWIKRGTRWTSTGIEWGDYEPDPAEPDTVALGSDCSVKNDVEFYTIRTSEEREKTEEGEPDEILYYYEGITAICK